MAEPGPEQTAPGASGDRDEEPSGAVHEQPSGSATASEVEMLNAAAAAGGLEVLERQPEVEKTEDDLEDFDENGFGDGGEEADEDGEGDIFELIKAKQLARMEATHEHAQKRKAEAAAALSAVEVEKELLRKTAKMTEEAEAAKRLQSFQRGKQARKRYLLKISKAEVPTDLSLPAVNESSTVAPARTRMDALNVLEKAFQAMDVNNDGAMDRDEARTLVQLAGKRISEEKLDRAMAELDTSGDGRVEFAEFCKYWQDTMEETASEADEVYVPPERIKRPGEGKDNPLTGLSRHLLAIHRGRDQLLSGFAAAADYGVHSPLARRRQSQGLSPAGNRPYEGPRAPFAKPVHIGDRATQEETLANTKRMALALSGLKADLPGKDRADGWFMLGLCHAEKEATALFQAATKKATTRTLRRLATPKFDPRAGMKPVDPSDSAEWGPEPAAGSSRWPPTPPTTPPHGRVRSRSISGSGQHAADNSVAEGDVVPELKAEASEFASPRKMSTSVPRKGSFTDRPQNSVERLGGLYGTSTPRHRARNSIHLKEQPERATASAERSIKQRATASARAAVMEPFSQPVPSPPSLPNLDGFSKAARKAAASSIPAVQGSETNPFAASAELEQLASTTKVQLCSSPRSIAAAPTTPRLDSERQLQPKRYRHASQDYAVSVAARAVARKEMVEQLHAKSLIAQLSERSRAVETKLLHDVRRAQTVREAVLEQGHKNVRQQRKLQRLRPVPTPRTQDAAAEDGGTSAIFEQQMIQTNKAVEAETELAKARRSAAESHRIKIQQDSKRKQMYEQRWRKMHSDFLAGVKNEVGDSRKKFAEQRPRATLAQAMASASTALAREVETIDARRAALQEKNSRQRQDLAKHQQYFVRGQLAQEVVESLLEEKTTDIASKWDRHTTLQLPERDAIGREQSKRLTELDRPGLQAVLRLEASGLRPDELAKIRTAREELTRTAVFYELG